MNQTTKNRLGKNKWIVTHGDEPEFALYLTLGKAKTYSGGCSGYGLHNDCGYGYVEYSDSGSSTFFGRIGSIQDSELDEMNRQDVEERLRQTMERIEYLLGQHFSPTIWHEFRSDDYLLDRNNDLCFKCENGRTHRVYGVENIVVYHVRACSSCGREECSGCMKRTDLLDD